MMNSWLARRVGIRRIEARLREPRHQIVGVERGELAYAVHALAAQHAHVDVCAQQHAGVAHERRQAADGLRQVLLGEPAVFVAFLADHRNGHERQQARAHAHRARTRTAAAMRRGEGLVQVHVDDVEAHVTRTHLAENGVEVGAVVVQQAARVVDDLRHFLDAPLEHAAGGRIGEHDAGGIRTHRRLQRLDVDVAFVVDGNFLDHAAAHGGGGGIGAVRRDRHDDFVAREIAARAVIGADHRDAGEFAVRAGHGRQRHALHAGDFLQHLLQFEHAGEESLARRIRRQRMAVQETRQHRVLVTGLRVVLHRARTQRIEVRVDGEVELRQPGEVAHHFELAHLRQQRRLLAAQVFRNVGGDRVRRVALGRPLAEGAAAGREYSKMIFSGCLSIAMGSLFSGGAHGGLQGFSERIGVRLDVGGGARFGGADQQRVAELRVVVRQVEAADDAAARELGEHGRHGPIEQQHGLVEARRDRTPASRP